MSAFSHALRDPFFSQFQPKEGSGLAKHELDPELPLEDLFRRSPASLKGSLNGQSKRSQAKPNRSPQEHGF